MPESMISYLDATLHNNPTVGDASIVTFITGKAMFVRQYGTYPSVHQLVTLLNCNITPFYIPRHTGARFFITQ